MNQKELKELIDFLIERNIAEFEMERGDVKVRVKRGLDSTHGATAAPVVSSVPAHPHLPTPPLSTPPPHAPPAVEEDLHMVKSPIVGTFYESPAPGAAPFVKPGDLVQAGQVLCIIEAMKLMNEIEADVGGEVVKRLVNNNQAVEYGTPLFAIRAAKQ
jgi:acetyl-CoA carboxylase biotin carboxyl carrier protein